MSGLQNFIKEQLKDKDFKAAWEESQGYYERKRSITERRARIERVATIVGQRNVVKEITDSTVYFGKEHGKIYTSSLGAKSIKIERKLKSRKTLTSCTVVQKKQ